MYELFPNKVYYNFFDHSFDNLTHLYSSNHDKDEVINNRNVVNNYMNTNGLSILNQVHGNKVWEVSKPQEYGSEHEGDGLITFTKNLSLGIQTADCVPVLISDGMKIGALHCGWRSAIQEIIKAAINEMNLLLDKSIAVIGPCIRQESYEVDKQFFDTFIKQSKNNEQYFMTKKNNNFFFDLPGYVKSHLILNGINNIIDHEINTYNNTFSHRYNTHNNINCKKRILSVICIK